ncbi:MarR family winged helix-turn-helix transcriptional regulator [Streptomyces sp. NPDC048436]|uniref:MarR family winged helix-turn-helix transcriptional regulator n=1 Tax=Streptomyces sp. NPDC048436 TaxID=3365550 RepID=UPI003722C870
MDANLTPARRLLTAIKTAEQATQNAKNAAVRAAGMTMAQYNVMILLDETPGITSAELARRCFITPQAMSETVAKLEKNGWIERIPHPTHRHVRETRITPAGQGLLQKADRKVLTLERALRTRLSATEQDQLRALLAAATEVAQQHHG